MSHFATPFIVINLGCEMIYVIDQRLKTQSVPLEKSERVLTDLVTVLLHPKLLDELFLPQPVATHKVIKQLLQDISETSIMKLDDYSKNKLWDLMTMLFKWQLSVATTQNVFDISKRHLRNVMSLMPEYFSKFIFENTLNKFEILIEKFSDNDFHCLCTTLILWFSEYHTKISVLIRLGLQKKDGTFSLPSSINSKILKNLGENVYKYDYSNKNNLYHDIENRCIETNEINCLLPSIDKGCNEDKVLELKLPIDFQNEDQKRKIITITKSVEYENITACIKHRNSDLTYSPNVPKSPQEHLLEMLNETL
ncbi:unnamed protein product [Danaus chrysippus]|uniref:(African queen) hypothetical protein n=1 Tax=Danaus chrysippus TaxID=151541 RepID=A0A8J2QKE8_9NEOP|nr:unnamed protein product [Danaus chrysippus]